MAATTIGDLFVRLGVDTSVLMKGFDAAEHRMEKFGTQMFFLGSRITAGVSIPTAAAAAAIANFGLDFDKAMTESLAIMSNVDRQMRPQMENVAKSIVDISKFSAKEGAEGFYHLASAGLDAATAMGALPIAARFAQAGVFDLAKATEFLSGAQAAMATGSETAAEKVDQMARVADVLTLANNRALGTVQDFAEALTNKAGAALRQSHKDIEEGTAVLAAYASQNIKGKTAGQQLWMVIRDLGTFALKNADEFKKFNIAVYNQSGNMRNLADIIGDVERATMKMSDAERADMFIKLGIPLRSVAATKALLGYSEAIREHERALRAAGGTTKDVADNQMGAMSNQLLQLQHSFEVTAAEIFQSFVPTIRDYVIPAVKDVLGMFRSLGQFVAGMPEPVKALALGLTGVAIAVGPLIAFLGSMTLLSSAALRGLSVLTAGINTFSTTVGLAAGGAQLFATNQNMLRSALGLTSSTMDTVVLTGSALRASQDLVAKAAEAGARAMGMNAAAIANAGLEAKILLTNQNRLAAGQAAMNGVIAASTRGTGLWGAALGVLSNPLTIVIGLVGAAATAWYLYERSQEAGRQAIIDNAVAYRNQTTALETSLDVFDKLHGKVLSGTQYQIAYVGAVDNLSKASGLSRDAFLKEAGASDQLTAALREQANARKDLFTEIGNRLKTDVSDTLNRLQDLKARLADVESGKAMITGTGPNAEARKMTMDERLDAAGRLRLAIQQVGKEADEATVKLQKFFGGGKGSTMLTYEGPQLSKKEIARRYEEQLAQVKAAGGNTTELEAAWRKLLYPAGTDDRSGMPAVETKLDAAKKAAKSLAEEWMGAGKEMDRFRMAWAGLSDQAKKDPVVLDRVWQSYDKLRHETGVLIPELEDLFKVQVQDQVLKMEIANTTKDWANTMSAATTAVVDDIDNFNMAVFKLKKSDAKAFWEQNGEAVAALIPVFDSLEPKVQAAVLAYQHFKIAAGPSAEYTKGARSALEAMSDFVDKAEARVEDVNTELIRSAGSAGETHRSVLRSKLAEIANDQDKHYRDALSKLALFTGKEHTEYVAYLNRLKVADKAYLDIYKANEDYKFAASIGVNSRILRNWIQMSDKQRQEIIKTRLEWLKMVDTMGQIQGLTGALGSMFTEMGGSAAGFGEVLSNMAGTMGALTAAGETFEKGGIINELTGIVQATGAVIKAYKQMSDTGSEAYRVLQGAATGAQVGYQVGGPIGAGIGAGIGALVGAFMGDPDWKQLQDTVTRQWNVKISKELAKQIDKDSVMIGGHVNAMLLHLTDIAATSGGLTASNVGDWAKKLSSVFSILGAGEITTSNAAKVLDASFGDLVKTGTTTNGIVSDQITNLVQLERQFKTGSAAIQEFVDKQLALVSGGFNKVVAGSFGGLMGSLSQMEEADTKLDKLTADRMKLEAKIADFRNKPPTNEKQRVQLLLAERDLITTNFKIAQEQAKQHAELVQMDRLITGGTAGQEEFDRMGRLALTTFNAMTASGKGFLESLDAIGPALDTLTLAQEKFGFASSEAFQQLMGFRQFAVDNPALVASIGGINDMMVGLNNLGFLNTQTFADLGAQAVSTFNEIIAKGKSSDDAMMLMHPTLQTLWELQQKFKFKVDESTQSLIDQAVASGTVGKDFMSANDKMVLGIDKLIGRFDLFLKHLGIDIPAEAETAADALNNQLGGVHPTVTVDWRFKHAPGDEPPPDQGHFTTEPIEPPGGYPQPAMAEGGVLTGPHTVTAGEAGPEAYLPLDRLFDQMDKMYADRSGDQPVTQNTVNVSVTAPYYLSEEEYIAKRITRGVLETIGGGDEPGMQDAITRIVENAIATSHTRS